MVEVRSYERNQASDSRCFICFDFDHNEKEKNLFAGQAKNSRTPFSIADWSSKLALPQNQWEKIINDKISKCNLMIVLVGQYMTTASGVDKEINFARQWDVPYFGVYVGEANSASYLPPGLERGRVINWEWDSIAEAIKQVLKEGKNA